MEDGRSAPASEGGRHTRPRRLVRAVAAAALLAAAIGVGHAVAIDELLGKRRLVDIACRHPERFLFGWDRAESPVPGRLHLVNVWIRTRGNRDEWWFRIREATLTFSPLELVARRFHVTSLSGKGFAFWWRDRRKPSEARPALADVLPPIPGFAAVPREDEPPIFLPPPGKKFWTVDVDRIALADVSDLWIDRARFRGSARVSGRFLLKPHRLASVDPATVELLSGAVTLDARPLLESIEGRLAADIRPFEPAEVRRMRSSFWDYASGSLRLRAAARDLAPLARLLPKVPLAGDRTAVGARLALARGGTVKGNVALDAARVTLTLPRAEVRAHASLHAAVRAFSLKTRDLALGPTRLELRDAAVRGPESAEGWWARLTFPGVRAGHGGLTGEPTLACRDALPIVGYVSPRTPGWVRRLVAMPGMVATARLRTGPRLLAFDRLEAQGSGARVTGRYEKQGERRDGALLIEKGKLAVGVRLDGGKAKLEVLGARKWFDREMQLPAAGRER